MEKRPCHCVLECYCATCRQTVAVELYVLAKPLPRFREASLLWLGSEISVVRTPVGAPAFLHRPCGALLVAGNAKPLLSNPLSEGSP